MFYFLTDTAATTTDGGMGGMLLMLAAMVAIFYFMLIRPENKRKKEAEQMRSAVKKGDKVVTIGGIYGTVSEIKENTVLIEVDNNVKIRVSKQALVKDFTDPSRQ